MFKKKPTPPATVRQRQPVQPGGPRGGSLVFSYHASARPVLPATKQKGIPKQPAPAAARRKASVKWVTRRPKLAALAVLVIVLADLVLGVNPKIQVTGAQTGQIFLRTPSVYAQAAHDMLAGSVFNRNKITIDTTSVAKRMQDKFPELSGVSVALPVLGAQPTVYIQPATPRLLLAGRDGMYVLDDSGRALIAASQVPHIGTLGLPTVVDQSGLAVQLGHITLSSSSVFLITEVTGQLKAKGVAFTSLVLPQGTSELDVKISGAPYTIKFNLRGDARAEVGTYLAVAGQLAKEKKVPGEYIDVRVDQRAYYK